MTLVDGQSHAVLAACDVAVVASGTATLEAAHFERPMAIVYAMHALSWQMMKRMKCQPWVGLRNILLEGFVVPALRQDAATPDRIARETLAGIDQPDRAAAAVAKFRTLHDTLARDTAGAATAAIADVLAGHRRRPRRARSSIGLASGLRRSHPASSRGSHATPPAQAARPVRAAARRPQPGPACRRRPCRHRPSAR